VRGRGHQSTEESARVIKKEWNQKVDDNDIIVRNDGGSGDGEVSIDAVRM
jgi:hypothetical protein